MNRKNHNLLRYLEQYNSYRRFNDQEPVTLDQCQEEKVYMALFLALNCQLSPENLCCDGELRGRALQSKARMLNGAWEDLQKISGRIFEVDDEAIYAYEEKLLDEHDCPECGYTGYRENPEVPVPYEGEVTFHCLNCGNFKIKASVLRGE